MERRVLKILHEAFREFPGFRIIYFLWDTTMKIKKKHFYCRAAHISGYSSPRGIPISLIPELP